MDQVISQFFTVGTAVLAVSVWIATFFIRRIVETAVPSVKKKAHENEEGLTYETKFAEWWNKVILYSIPVLVGSGIGAFEISYLFDAQGLDSMGARFFYGGVVGWFSSYAYKIVRMALKKRTGVDIQPSPSVLPGADSSPPSS